MAKFVVKGGVVQVNGVDISSHVKSVEVKREKAKIDATGLNGNGAMEWTQGLSDEELDIEVMNDFDPGEIDDTLNPLYENETEFALLVRPFAGAASASNPEFSCLTCKLFTYHPISGKVGELSTTTVTITANGGFTRTP
jgi:hypothetical protein